MSAALELRTVRTLAEFAALAPQWNGLVCSMRRPTPFMLHGWLEAWWMHHGHEREMRVEAALDGDVLVAAIPLEIERRFGLRVGHLMGRHHAALGDLLVAPDAKDDVLRELLDHVRASSVDWLDLFGPSREGVLLGRAMPSDLVAIERVEAPVLEIPGGWDEAYRRNVSGKKRNLHRRRRRQLEALGSVSVTVATQGHELAAALEAAFRLHDLRWRGRSDTSEFTTRAGKAFHRAAATNLARDGVPRILLLLVDGKPVAFHYGMLFEGVFFNHRLAFDPALARLSPGLVTTLEAIVSAVGAGAQRVEFLGGGERYKLELADRIDPIYQCIGLATTRRGGVGASVSEAALRGKLRLKRSHWIHETYVNGLGPLRRASERVAKPFRHAGR